MQSLMKRVEELEKQLEISNSELEDSKQKNADDALRIGELKQNIKIQRDSLKLSEGNETIFKERLVHQHNKQKEILSFVKQLHDQNVFQPKCLFASRPSERRECRDKLIEQITTALETSILASDVTTIEESKRKSIMDIFARALCIFTFVVTKKKDRSEKIF